MAKKSSYGMRSADPATSNGAAVNDEFKFHLNMGKELGENWNNKINTLLGGTWRFKK